MSRKPDGIYCIPIFSGAENAGHWHLVVIHKCRRNYLGWILDSLNTETGDDIIHRKIATAFCPGRNTFRWETRSCLPQVELECGIRVLSGILDIANGLQNDDSIADCILSASRINNPNDSYNPIVLRQRIALLINTHQPSMIATLSRRRRRQLQSSTSNHQRNKKRKQLKKSRKPTTEPIQIDWRDKHRTKILRNFNTSEHNFFLLFGLFFFGLYFFGLFSFLDQWWIMLYYFIL